MQNANAEKEEKRTGCYRHTQMQKDLIIEKLKERGLRITRQRSNPTISGLYWDRASTLAEDWTLQNAL